MIDNEYYLARCRRFLAAQPHMRKLGIRVIQAQQSRVTLVLPVQSQLISEGLDTYLHGGVLTTLVDAASSASTLCALEAFELCPTLDLRIDHMRTPVQSQPLYVAAECYRVTRSVLFTRASVYQEDPSRPMAYGIATFMRPEGGAEDSLFARLIDGDEHATVD
ncbi:PaaI family thioesterase [Marinobacterium weihaiense]|uniref:PaaI family thioesterase n=1 Tax=Marinobacterium weihaiense TaxID=2851016 RepID=A0ABS6M6V1_9GAMM|nr:PaaI family thioesterase [Marinobacterium weihaiense]MBV0932009.1 PaaI family thioesterase [Marinobacterium weihaiense]